MGPQSDSQTRDQGRRDGWSSSSSRDETGRDRMRNHASEMGDVDRSRDKSTKTAGGHGKNSLSLSCGLQCSGAYVCRPRSSSINKSCMLGG